MLSPDRCHVHVGSTACGAEAVARVFDEDDPHIGTPACKDHVMDLGGVVEVDFGGLGAYWARYFSDLGRQVRAARGRSTVRLCPPEAKA